MYKITPELKANGFSIHALDEIIKRNHGNRQFNTMGYFVIYLVMNRTQMLINNKKYDLEAGNFVFLAPFTDVTYCADCENEGQVYVFVFNAAFYEQSAADSQLLNSELFFNTQDDVYITSSVASVEEVKKIFIDRLAMFKEKKHTGLYVALVHNCIEILILNGLYYIEDRKTQLKGNYLYIDTANQFRVLLQKEYKNSRNVSYYAEALHVTPRRLTEITESWFGKPAKQIIIDKIISESTRELKHSNLTIAEIAHEVGFSDEGNFSAFFKKHTGNSPSDLRKAEYAIF
ncbi:helix-turn-helix domain-containing protein [Mariniflexile ostreae]|uniref:Helix-turn-helix domain-containing protein n=1 Tax=Mariniflexile ostreae TaxID=1520892 RepID=A0ABV5F6U7_9FLAO